MAKTLSATIGVKLAGAFANTLDIGAQNYAIEFGPNNLFTNGAGAGQASIVFVDTRTISASGTDDLDLNGTALQDALGANLGLTKVKAIIILADASNTNNVVLGGAASNQAPIFADVSDKIAIKPGGFFAISDPSAAGYTITAATGDILRIANSGAGTAVTYTIFIIGA